MDKNGMFPIGTILINKHGSASRRGWTCKVVRYKASMASVKLNRRLPNGQLVPDYEIEYLTGPLAGKIRTTIKKNIDSNWEELI